MTRKWIIALAVTGVALGSVAAAASASAQRRAGAWTISTTSTATPTAYSAISTQGTRNAWAVGSRSTVERWDGQRWITMPTPRFALPKGSIVNFDHVVTVSASDTWISGGRSFGSRGFQPVYAHWFHGRWYTHVLPANYLIEHISVFARNNVWLLGAYVAPRTYATSAVAWHYSGSGWTKTSLPAVPNSASGDDQHWAAAQVSRSRGALLHYTGGRWVADTSLRSALPSGWSDFIVSDVVQRSADDVYAAVGPAETDGIVNRPGVRLFHWNGRTWTSVISLPKDGPGPLTNDGYGGFWTLSQGVGVKQTRLLDIRDGKVVASTTLPRFSGKRFDTGDLTLRPSTRIVWASGAIANESNTVSHATVAAYRR